MSSMRFSRATRWSRLRSKKADGRTPRRPLRSCSNMRRSWLSAGAIWCLGSFYAGASAFAPATTPASYVGDEQCKLCHRAIYESWTATPHARVADLPDPPGEARCVACHETPPGGPARVGCEACHGPGADYWPAEVMIDPEKAAMAGLVRPDEATCRRCHDNEEPNHRDFVMPTPSEWRRTIHLLGEP